MNLALRLRHFLVQLPLVAIPAKLINCGSGDGGSFVLGQS
jgi:hypothetical protein